jgi:hypothetical protein
MDMPGGGADEMKGFQQVMNKWAMRIVSLVVGIHQVW